MSFGPIYQGGETTLRVAEEGQYTLNPSAGTLTLADPSAVIVLTVVNMSRSVVLYDSTKDHLGGPFSGGVLTFRRDVSGQSASDTLQITYLASDHHPSETDAFGRLRVGEPKSLFDSTFNYDLQPLLFNTSTSGTGTITHNANEVAADLSTGGTASGAEAIIQSKQYFPYQPGKSMLWVWTATMGGQKADVLKRVGPHGSSNGVFFEDDGAALKWVVRSKVSGSVVDNAVTQTSWNLDTLDGNGPSGITLDCTKDIIFSVDYQWLGAGRVRCGFDLGQGKGVIYAHQFDHSMQNDVPYSQSGTLPIRASIENTDTAASSTTFSFYCCSVTSEGGFDPIGIPFSAGNEDNFRTVGTGGLPLCSIKPRTTFNSITNRSSIFPTSLTLSNADATAYWQLILGGSLTGASFADVDTTNSTAQLDVAATDISGGVVIDSGYIGAASGNKFTGNFTSGFTDKLVLATNLDASDGEILTLYCVSTSGNTSMAGAITWEEVR